MSAVCREDLSRKENWIILEGQKQMRRGIMSWKEKCFMALDAEKMFEDSGHRTRFLELVECYSGYPFFTKGLCKCMYLAAWDEEHFFILLQTLTNMALEREQDTEDMKFQGDMLADENADANAIGEAYIYQLSGAFLEGREFKPKKEVALSERYQYIVERGLKAAEIIDKL